MYDVSEYLEPCDQQGLTSKGRTVGESGQKTPLKPSLLAGAWVEGGGMIV